MKKNHWRALMLALALSASFLTNPAVVLADTSQSQIEINASLVRIRNDCAADSTVISVGRRGETYPFIASKIDEEGGSWYQVELTPARSGWIASQYARLRSTASTTTTGTSATTTTTTTAPSEAPSPDDATAGEIPATPQYVTATYGVTYLREEAKESSPVIARLSYGHTYPCCEILKISQDNVWYKIQYTAETQGWVSAESSKIADAAKYNGKTPQQVTVDTIAHKYGAIGVQVAITENGEVTDTYNSGYATLENNTPMTTHTKIRAASISKVAVGLAAMKMQEEGIVDLDTDIGQYWGVTLPHPTTLRDLLTHTSYFKGNYYKHTRQETAAQISSLSSTRATNDWFYNNYAIGIAGATLEVASGETLNHYMSRKFFAPLGIDAAFTSGDIEDTSLLATLYYSNDTLARSVFHAKTIKAGDPGTNATEFSGGLTISARDMAKLTALLANDGVYWDKRYLKVASVQTMETTYCDANARGCDFKQCIPLRYQTDIYGQEEMYYHLGTAYGTLSYMGYNPKTKKGMVIITTGADAGYDDRGTWNICASMAQYFYQNDQ